MPRSHGPGKASGQAPRLYPAPYFPFPWPEDLICGDAYINWPAGKDLVLFPGFQAEIAVPERFIEVGEERNSTKERWSLVFTKPRSLSFDRYGNGTRHFIPLFRNLNFTTDRRDSHRIEYLGSPSSITPSRLTKTHVECEEPYHLLIARAPDASIGSMATTLWLYHVLKEEGPDFMLRLYTESSMRAAGATNYAMKEQSIGPECAEPVAQSGIFSVCDARGRHAKIENGTRSCWGFTLPQYWNQPGSTNRLKLNTVCTPETPKAKSNGGGVNKGLVIGLPVGLGGGLLLIAIISAILYKRHARREGTIRL